MNRIYRYHCATACGASDEFTVEERSESIAAVEAKIHVERWLRTMRALPSALVAFDLLSVTPAP